jgi:hypothetical protein
MTPTWAPPAAAGALELAAGAGAELVAAVGAELVAAAGADDDGVVAVDDFLLLQPAMPSPATAATATSLIAVLFMHDPLLLPGRRTWCPAGLPSCCGAQHMHPTAVHVRATRAIFAFGMDLLSTRNIPRAQQRSRLASLLGSGFEESLLVRSSV